MHHYDFTRYLNHKETRGQRFVLTDYWRRMTLTHTSSDRPQANPLSERINNGIKLTILDLQKGHFINTPSTQKHFYNFSVHSSTGSASNQLHFGINLSLIFDTFQFYLELLQLNKT